jgi:16S rRNA G1207 methylase RsmC
VNSGDSAHYFDVDDDDLERLGSAPKRVTWTAFGEEFAATSDRGVFSYGHLDKGTAVLFELAPRPPQTGVFLDIGCGWGPISLTLARLSPHAHVHAIDVNPRAITLTAANAKDAGCNAVHVSSPADVHPGLRFDLIWSNPPIRIGKQALHELLAHWLARLTPTGTAYLVVQKNLGADSLADWLAGNGYVVDRLGSRKGFRVLRVRRGQ